MEDGEIQITPFSERNLTPNGYDLSLSLDVYKMTEIPGALNAINQESWSEFLKPANTEGEIHLEPFKPVSVLSKERIAIDRTLIAIIHSRSSIGKAGIFVHFGSGVVDSGFGMDSPQRLVFTLMSCNPNPVILHSGQPIAQLVFHSIDNPLNSETRYSSYQTQVEPKFDIINSLSEGKKITLGITGLAGSGKSEVSRKISNCFNIDHDNIYEMGQIVRDEANERGEESSVVSKQLREEGGGSIIADLLLERIEREPDNNLKIVEGIRSQREVTRLQEELSSEFILLGVHSSPKTRLSRLLKRKREDDPENMEELQKRDEKEARFGIRKAITNSDHIITNESSLQELHRDIERIAAKILQDVNQ